MSAKQLRSPYQSNSSVPLVTTQAATGITASQATGNGTVVFDHGSTITERGFVWNTTGWPTTSDTKQTAAGTTGAYTATLSGLSGSTTYYYRAYASNAFGTGYGDVWIFITSAPVVVNTGGTLLLIGVG